MTDHHQPDHEPTAESEAPNDIADAGSSDDRPRGRRRRSWWPALIGAGLAATAAIGVIVLRADDTAVAPVQTEPGSGTGTGTDPTTGAPDPTSMPTTTAVPSTTGPGPTGASLVVDGGCITVTTVAGNATGCPSVDAELDHLEQRVFVADLDGPVLITSGSADPLVDLDATIDTGSFASRCQWSDLARQIPDGRLVEVVVCNDTGVMGLSTPAGPSGDTAVTYFTLPTPYLPDGADLGPGTPIDGMPRALGFTAPVSDTAVCSVVLLPDRTAWREVCGEVGEPALATALIEIGPSDPAHGNASTPGLYEITIAESGLVTDARLLLAVAPSSGCSIDSATRLVQLVAASSIVTGMGCIDDKAALTTGSVLTQQGPPDGAVWTALRDEAGSWSITDTGTGIDGTSAFPIVPMSVWDTWPESTVPGFRSYWWEPIVAIPAQPTIEAFATEVLATLGTLGADPEFPLNERLVEVRPAGLPLIIGQVDIGGDDSVAGQVIYVWINEDFDENGLVGWRAGEVLVGEVCARSESAGQELCV